MVQRVIDVTRQYKETDSSSAAYAVAVSPSPEAPPYDPDDIVPWTIGRAGNAIGKVFWQRLGEVGLKPHLYGILLHLSREPGLSSAELARRVLVTPQSMGELLRGLADDGLIRRPAETQRGRPLNIQLTAAGHAALAQATPVITAMNDPAYLGLTAAESRQLNELLHRVLVTIEAPRDQTPDGS